MEKLIQLGVYKDLSLHEKKKVRLLNILVFVLLIFKVLFISIDFTQGKTSFVLGHSIDVFNCALILFLQKKRRYVSARWLYICVLFFSIAMFAFYLQPDSLYEYLFLILPAVGLIFFDRKPATLGILIFCMTSFVVPNLVLQFSPKLLVWPGTKLALFISIYVIVDYFKKLNKENEDELRNQKEELSKVYERQNQFFINVAHEIRTPLTIIQGKNQRLLNGLKGTEWEKHTLSIHENNNKIKTLVDDIMDLSKIDNDSFHLNKEEINIDRLILKTCSSFETNFEQKDIKLFLKNGSKDAVIIYADAKYLERAIGNLFTNALKYTPVGHSVHITTEDLGSEFKITVKDTGIGIRKEEVDKIFNRFYQVKNDINLSGGSGIGLAFTKEIIQLHRGSILLESAIDLGTKIEIRLPILHRKTSSNSLEVDIKEDSQVNTRKTKYKILLVEDNVSMRSYLKEVLVNYHVSLAEDGLNALNLLKAQSFDLVITDFMMPKMNGYNLVKNLKEQGYHLPVIMITAIKDDQTKLDMLRLGIDDYLEKPFLEAELLARIDHSLVNYASSIEIYPPENKDVSDSEFIKKVKYYIWENCSASSFSKDDLLHHFGLSSSTFLRRIKSESGLSPNKIITEVRLQKAKKIVYEQEDWNAKSILSEIGWTNVTYFYDKYQERFGIDLRKNQE